MSLKNRKIKLLTDLELLNEFKVKGDQNYLGVLYKRYMPLVFGVCMKYLKNESRAKDSTMEIYELCVDKLMEAEVQNFKGWLYVVVKNHCLMLLRKNSRQPKEINWPIENFEEINGYDFIKEEKIELMIQKMEGLNPLQKECLSLFFLENKSYQEVATLLELEIKKVKSHIQNGKRNLKLLLQKEHVFKMDDLQK